MGAESFRSDLLIGILRIMNKTTAAPFNLTDHGLTVSEVHRNLPPSSLYEHAIRFEKDASIAENGALVAYSGVKTGRSLGRREKRHHVTCSNPRPMRSSPLPTTPEATALPWKL